MQAPSVASTVDKVELHCHIDGLLDGAMVRRLAERGHVLPVPAEAFDRVVPVRSAEAWQHEYAPLVTQCMRAADPLPAMVALHVENLIAQRVLYAEIMVSGLLDPRGQEGPVVDRFRVLRDAVDRASRGAIVVGLLVAVGRGPAARFELQAARILALARHGLIAGVAIAGDERACTIASLGPLLRPMRDAGLGIEIHAGETAGPESVWDALEHGRPDRIGHGVRAFEDERLVGALGERQVHLEICPTSNLRLGVVPDLREHPIARARQLGLSFSVHTDDPGPLGCSMRSELELLERELGFDLADFEKIRASAYAARFAGR